MASSQSSIIANITINNFPDDPTNSDSTKRNSQTIVFKTLRRTRF